jgi:hypothetical protein
MAGFKTGALAGEAHIPIVRARKGTKREWKRRAKRQQVFLRWVLIVNLIFLFLF